MQTERTATEGRNALRREGVPSRRRNDPHAGHPPDDDWDEEELLMSEKRVGEIMISLTVENRIAVALSQEVERQVRCAIRDDRAELLEVARAVAAVSKQLELAKMDKDSTYGPDHPLHASSPMVTAARRLCLRHGYTEHGAHLLGGMTHRVITPEDRLLSQIGNQCDYTDAYRFLLAEARRQGFGTVHEAIVFAGAARKN